MNAPQKVATLETLLARVKANAAKPHPPKQRGAATTAVASAGTAENLGWTPLPPVALAPAIDPLELTGEPEHATLTVPRAELDELLRQTEANQAAEAAVRETRVAPAPKPAANVPAANHEEASFGGLDEAFLDAAVKETAPVVHAEAPRVERRSEPKLEPERISEPRLETKRETPIPRRDASPRPPDAAPRPIAAARPTAPKPAAPAAPTRRPSAPELAATEKSASPIVETRAAIEIAAPTPPVVLPPEPLLEPLPAVEPLVLPVLEVGAAIDIAPPAMEPPEPAPPIEAVVAPSPPPPVVALAPEAAPIPAAMPAPVALASRTQPMVEPAAPVPAIAKTLPIESAPEVELPRELAPSSLPSAHTPPFAEPAPLPKKSGGLVWLLVAAVLVGGGLFLAKRGGLIGDGSDPLPQPTAAPTVKPAPTAAPTAVTTAAPALTAAPTTEPSAAPTAAPSAAPTAAPSAAPVDGPDATQLANNQGYLTVKTTGAGTVFVQGVAIGPVNQRNVALCGARFIRIADAASGPPNPPRWISAGTSVVIPCRGESSVDVTLTP